jgi:hypothetical protein
MKHIMTVLGAHILTRSVVAVGLLFLLASVPLLAKGQLVLIEISGATLGTPVRITDAKIENFSPWAGPGTSTNGVENTEGFIVDWKAGVVKSHGAGLQHYEVSFYASCHTETNDPRCLTKASFTVGMRLVYVVFYDYDPSLPRGFVYLPGKGSSFYYLNMGSIARGCEGNWFLAKDSWEDFIRPLMAKTLKCYGCLMKDPL